MIVVDTNVLYALADRRDKHHAECTPRFRGNDDVLLVPPTVVAEACYLIDRYLGPTAEAAFPDCGCWALRLSSLVRPSNSRYGGCSIVCQNF